MLIFRGVEKKTSNICSPFSQTLREDSFFSNVAKVKVSATSMLMLEVVFMIFLPRNHKFFAISRRGRWWLDLKLDEHILTNGWFVVISMGSRLIVVGIFFQMELLNVHPPLMGIEGLRCGLYAAEQSGYIYIYLHLKTCKTQF